MQPEGTERERERERGSKRAEKHEVKKFFARVYIKQLEEPYDPGVVH